ncbi:MAG: hypothetical protein VKJ46_01145 [Leptolyngbyaceae bacterium]|nr:hypothetical protein [Leptolyngbyaceae bacterium]
MLYDCWAALILIVVGIDLPTIPPRAWHCHAPTQGRFMDAKVY